MLTQIHEVKSFLTQQTASSGRGPCSLSCGRANIEIQMHVARAYATEFNNDEARSMALHENTNPEIFIRSSGARHRPVKTKTSIQGEYVQKKKQRKTTVKKTSHINLAHQITVAEGILTEKEINCSPPCSQEPHKDNVPEVVLMAALGIRRCHGCQGEILKQNCQCTQRSSVQDASSLNMENKGAPRLATMLWKCLFHLEDIRPVVT